MSLASIVAQSQPFSIKANRDSVREKKLRELEFTLNKLLMERDFKTYATHLADDYVRISANGDRKTKEEVLQDFEKSESGESVREVLQVRMYGNTAIMNIQLKLMRLVMGKTVTRESLFTKVFVSREGRRYMVSNTGTPLTQASSSK